MHPIKPIYLDVTDRHGKVVRGQIVHYEPLARGEGSAFVHIQTSASLETGTCRAVCYAEEQQTDGNYAIWVQTSTLNGEWLLRGLFWAEQR